MNADPQTSIDERIVPLSATGRILRLRGPARIRVVRGTVWLTIAGRPDDHVLTPGDHVVLERGGDAIAQSMHGRASLAVIEAAPSRLQRAVDSLLATGQRVVAGWA